MRRFDRRYMMAMHCTRKLALEKILGLHYRGFEILSRVFTRPCEISPSKNSHFSTRVEKVRLTMPVAPQLRYEPAECQKPPKGGDLWNQAGINIFLDMRQRTAVNREPYD